MFGLHRWRPWDCFNIKGRVLRKGIPRHFQVDAHLWNPFSRLALSLHKTQLRFYLKAPREIILPKNVIGLSCEPDKWYRIGNSIYAAWYAILGIWPCYRETDVNRFVCHEVKIRSLFVLCILVVWPKRALKLFNHSDNLVSLNDGIVYVKLVRSQQFIPRINKELAKVGSLR